MDLFNALFGDLVDGDGKLAGWLSVFSMPSRKCRQFDNLATAHEYCMQISATEDVYFGCSLLTNRTNGRGTLNNVAAITSLWADVDFAMDGDTKARRSSDDFEKLLAELPFPPSIIVDSGHGRHLYWLLAEPWMLSTESERSLAVSVSLGWQRVVQNAGSRLGWSIDGVGDLTRVLRVPGTINHKNEDNQRIVSILKYAPRAEYLVADFMPYSTEIQQPQRGVLSAIGSGVISSERFAEMSVSQFFVDTWERRRHDLVDQSASSYDLSLATIAAYHGCSDEEIATLLFQWRTKHGDRPEKARRLDYIQRTISRARGSIPDTEGVDLSGFSRITSEEPEPTEFPEVSTHTNHVDPGIIPIEMFRVPGLISELMDHCLSTSPYPNIPLAFCGALALQATLAGRKIRDESDVRTNIYLLALANSGSGKDWPRKINSQVLHEIGRLDSIGERFASAEGIEDSLSRQPVTLFQTDEIDSLLRSIGNSRDTRHDGILSCLMTIYSASNSIYPVRKRAGKDSPGVIDQPCMVLYGTAIPQHYYEALSERMLTNGFLSRTLIVEARKRPSGQEGSIAPVPRRIIDVAKWWLENGGVRGNLASTHPDPRTVIVTAKAKDLLKESRIEADEEYARAEDANNAVGMTIWSRAQEHVRKLALIHAVSESHQSPEIDTKAVRWADRFVRHQIRRLLYMVEGHVAINPFDSQCLKLIRKIKEAGGNMSHMDALRAMRIDAKAMRDIVESLIQQGKILASSQKTKGKPHTRYFATVDFSGMESGRNP